MSNLETHEAEQAEITAAYEAASLATDGAHPGPWFCGVTINWGNNDLQEIWGVHEDEATARTAYAEALQLDNLHCACIGPIITATEPHWTEQGGV